MIFNGWLRDKIIWFIRTIYIPNEALPGAEKENAGVYLKREAFDPPSMKLDETERIFSNLGQYFGIRLFLDPLIYKISAFGVGILTLSKFNRVSMERVPNGSILSRERASSHFKK